MGQYRTFIESYSFSPKIIRCLFINAFNNFFAARILADSGLITQVNNSLRMGLESEWIGIILVKDEKLGHIWVNGPIDKKEENALINLEIPSRIRKNVGETSKIKISDRNDIYKALSDRSHTKISSVTSLFFTPGSSEEKNYIDCIPLGGLRGDYNFNFIRHSIKTVLRFALADIEECLNYKSLEDGWAWNRGEILNITRGGHPGDDGKIVPFISSQNHPEKDFCRVAAFLSSIRNGDI